MANPLAGALGGATRLPSSLGALRASAQGGDMQRRARETLLRAAGGGGRPRGGPRGLAVQSVGGRLAPVGVGVRGRGRGVGSRGGRGGRAPAIVRANAPVTKQGTRSISSFFS